MHSKETKSNSEANLRAYPYRGLYKEVAKVTGNSPNYVRKVIRTGRGSLLIAKTYLKCKAKRDARAIEVLQTTQRVKTESAFHTEEKRDVK